MTQCGFDKLDKVVIVEIRKYLTLHNDYLALLVTCKRLYYFLKNIKTTPLITLQYYTWSKKDTKTTVFLDLYRKRKNIIDTSMLVRWRGKYTRGWYDRSGNARRIEIIDSSCLDIFKEAVLLVGYDPVPVYLYSQEDENIVRYVDFENNTVKCDNGFVQFPDELSLKDFIKEIEYIHRHKKEAELRWDYKEEKEIRLK